MGLAASQVRLLSLTSRQHTIEGQAQYLQAQKLRLANESDHVYNNYISALDATSLQTKTYDSEGKLHWIDGSFNNLLRYDATEKDLGNVYYVQDIRDGKLYMPEAVYNAYDSCGDNLLKFFENLNITSMANEDSIFKEYYEDIFYAIKAAGGSKLISTSNAKSATWVNNMIKNAQVVLATYNRNTEELDNITASSNTGLREISNDTAVARADSEYEVALETINEKERKYDIKLKQLETERNAIQSEIESLKQIAEDNIGSTFKLFS